MTADIERALGYPYDIPDHSYILRDGELHMWQDGVDLSGRTPVLACGSNQSPVQLKRKFPQGEVYVSAGWLTGYDSVYSAHFTAYGSIAATYCAHEKACSRQMITWLNDIQLEDMHKTEALGINYEFVELSTIQFESDDALHVDKAFTYQSLWGPYLVDENPVSIATIGAKDRPYQAMTQKEIQHQALSQLDYPHSLEEFIVENIQDLETRRKRTVLLSGVSK